MLYPLSSPIHPFIIEHRRTNETPAGFTPDARLAVTAALRTSGLLAALSDEQVRTLLALLTFLSPNGVVQASSREVAQALATSEPKAQKRLERLASFYWKGEPILQFLCRETSLPVYVLSRLLYHTEDATTMQEAPPAHTAAPREEVIAQSRSTYARPRADVEREIAVLNGWDVPEEFATEEEKAHAEIKEKLMLQGIPKAQAEDLLSRFDLERITRQLEWLPYRQANKPGRFLIAAIEKDYEAPRILHEQDAREPADDNVGSAPSPATSPAPHPPTTAGSLTPGDAEPLTLP